MYHYRIEHLACQKENAFLKRQPLRGSSTCVNQLAIGKNVHDGSKSDDKRKEYFNDKRAEEVGRLRIADILIF